jgi:hypothetical protein
VPKATHAARSGPLASQPVALATHRAARATTFVGSWVLPTWSVLIVLAPPPSTHPHSLSRYLGTLALSLAHLFLLCANVCTAPPPSIAHAQANNGGYEGWNDFVLAWRGSPQPGLGSVQVWRNGVQVLPRTALATAYDDSDPPYMKFGVFGFPFSSSFLFLFCALHDPITYLGGSAVAPLISQARKLHPHQSTSRLLMCVRGRITTCSCGGIKPTTRVRPCHPSIPDTSLGGRS